VSGIDALDRIADRFRFARLADAVVTARLSYRL